MTLPGNVETVVADRFAVFGDLHLGRPGAPLACAVPRDEIVAAARSLADDHDLVVINGDLYDLERGVTPSQRREYRTLQPVYHALEVELSGTCEVWIRGNHDRVLATLGRAVDAVEIETPSGRFRVEHGDRFNPPIKRWPAFTTLVTWASGRARSTPALHPAYRAMRRTEAFLSRSGGEVDPVTAAAERWLEGTSSCAGLVIGHTHRSALQVDERGRLLVNPGPSVDRFRAASVDGATGVARLLEWDGGAMVETARIDLGATE